MKIFFVISALIFGVTASEKFMLSDFEEKFHVKKCPPSSTYSTCGTACPLTCENYQNPPTICTRQCVIGCFCDSGYVRNANGQCVLPEECPQQQMCPPFSTYNECGTACPLTCENYQNPPTICTWQCVAGCFCNSGYVRNANGQCVLPEDCPSIQQMCPPFSTYNECGTACPVTCENYSDSGISFNSCVDIDECVAGCFCNEGYVQYSIANNWCTKPNNCP